MRVGVIVLQHESNTFVPGETPLAAFERDTLRTGPAVRERYAGTHHEGGGFFEQLAADRVEAVPVFAAWTMPSGPIAADAAEELTSRLLKAVDEAGPVDGYLVAPHGAGVAAGEPDFDGHWLTALRRRVAVPVVGTLDLHGNLSPRMVSAADAWFAYRTNPHIDMRETGVAAAGLLVRTLRGEVRPTTAGAFPPLVVNIEAQATAESPCRELAAAADELRRRPGVLAVSVLLGFPYADVPEMGAAVTVTTDGDPVLAKKYAAELAGWWWDRREQFRGNLIGPAEAVRRANGSPGPVCLLDMGDNVGGGGPADGATLVHEWLANGAGPAFACLCAPEAVRRATAAGVGGTVELRVGNPELAGTFTVRGLSDGVFEETEPRHGGIRRFDQGPTAVVELAPRRTAGGPPALPVGWAEEAWRRGPPTATTPPAVGLEDSAHPTRSPEPKRAPGRGGPALTLMLTARRAAPFSLRQLTAFGVEPTGFRALIAKGVHAPRAAYAPVCPTLIRVNTPGVTAADLSAFAYHRRRRPLYPFEPHTAWTPEAQ